MVEVETLRRDNDTLEQQVQFLSQFRPDGLGMPANLMLTQHSKDARLDSRRDSETQSQSGREQDVVCVCVCVALGSVGSSTCRIHHLH